MKMSPYDLDAEEARATALAKKAELLVLSGQGIRFAVLGHYGFSAYECDTFAAAVARAQIAAGHARAFVAIRIEADLIDGIGGGVEKELVRFEVYPDRVALVPAGQGGLSDEQKAKAIALPKTRWHGKSLL